MTETQYYITKPGGRPTGPFSIDELESMAADGRLTAEHLYCVDGMAEWLPASRIVDFPDSEEAQPATPPAPVYVPKREPVKTYQPPTGDKPDTHRTAAITLTVLGFLLFPLSFLFAIIALVQSSRADNAWAVGDDALCRNCAQSAHFWCRVAGALIVLQILAVVAGAIYVGMEIIPSIEESFRTIQY